MVSAQRATMTAVVLVALSSFLQGCGESKKEESDKGKIVAEKSKKHGMPADETSKNKALFKMPSLKAKEGNKKSTTTGKPMAEKVEEDDGSSIKAGGKKKAFASQKPAAVKVEKDEGSKSEAGAESTTYKPESSKEFLARMRADVHDLEDKEHEVVAGKFLLLPSKHEIKTAKLQVSSVVFFCGLVSLSILGLGFLVITVRRIAHSSREWQRAMPIEEDELLDTEQIVE